MSKEIKNNDNVIKPFLVGITGGSGSGKSTLAYGLEEKYPEAISILRFDDYQVEDKNDVPMFEGFRNWDDPGCIEFDKLLHDLKELKEGRSVKVRTWGPRENPDYDITRERIVITVKPKPIILVEGYLVLWNKDVRNFFDLKIYLEASEDSRLKRRNKLQSDKHNGYDEKVLIPMHKKYVAPTKEYADSVFDASEISLEDLINSLEKLLPIKI